jgi:hypothetical protein
MFNDLPLVHEVKIPVVKEGNYCQFFDKKKYVISV